MPLPTPESTGTLITRTFVIPAELSPFLSGAIMTLTRLEGWEQFGNLTPQECVDFFYEAFLDSFPP